MSADPSDLTTLAAVRSLIGETDVTQTGNDAELQVCITAASRAIAVYTSREFVSAVADPATRVFAYYGGGRLSLQPYSLRSVDSVLLDTETDAPLTLVENTDFFVSPRGGDRDGVFDSIELPSFCGLNGAKQWREVEVTGTWGYETIPTEVSRAAGVLAAWWYRNTSTVPGLSLDGQGDRFGPSGWPTVALQLLAPYRVIGFGYGG